jgi:hypothetical protein
MAYSNILVGAGSRPAQPAIRKIGVADLQDALAKGADDQLGDGRVISGEHRALEFASRHRLGKHLTLQQVKAEFADSEEV